MKTLQLLSGVLGLLLLVVSAETATAFPIVCDACTCQTGCFTICRIDPGNPESTTTCGHFGVCSGHCFASASPDGAKSALLFQDGVEASMCGAPGAEIGTPTLTFR